MQRRIFSRTYLSLRMFVAIVMALVLIIQAPVQAQTTAAAATELKTMVTKLTKEVDERLAATDKALATIKQSSGASSSATEVIIKSLETNKKDLTELKSKLSRTATLADAKLLAKQMDDQYDKYASANVSAVAIKDSSAQQQVQKQLKTVVSDAQSMIDTAGAADMNVRSLQENLKGVLQLIESIGAIIAAVIALIASLASGNFSETSTIFKAIAGQLAQNLVSIDSAQNSLGGIVDTINNMQINNEASER